MRWQLKMRSLFVRDVKVGDSNYSLHEEAVRNQMPFSIHVPKSV